MKYRYCSDFLATLLSSILQFPYCKSNDQRTSTQVFGAKKKNWHISAKKKHSIKFVL